MPASTDSVPGSTDSVPARRIVGSPQRRRSSARTPAAGTATSRSCSAPTTPPGCAASWASTPPRSARRWAAPASTPTPARRRRWPTCSSCPGRWPTRTRWPAWTTAAARRSSSATPRRTSPRSCCGRTAASWSPSAGATSPPATSAPTSPTWTWSSRETRFATGRSEADGGAGDSSVLTALRRLPGHAGLRRAPVGLADPGRPDRGRRRGRQGRPPPGGPPGRGRRHRGRHRRVGGGASTRSARRHPQVEVVADAAALVRADLDVFSPYALGGALTDEVVAVLRADAGLRRRQQPARPPGHRGPAGRARDPLRPRLRGQLRRGDPGRRRAARLLLRAGPGQGRARSSTPPRRVLELAAGEGVPPAVAADRLAEERMAAAGG